MNPDILMDAARAAGHERLLVQNDRLQFILDCVESRLFNGKRDPTQEERQIARVLLEARLQNARDEVSRLESLISTYGEF